MPEDGQHLLAVGVRGVVVRGAEELGVSSAKHVAVSGNASRHQIGAVVLHLGTAGAGGVLAITEEVDERRVGERVPLQHLELHNQTIQSIIDISCECNDAL